MLLFFPSIQAVAESCYYGTEIPLRCMRNKKLDLIFSSFSVKSQNHSHKNSIVFRLARHLCSSTSLVTYRISTFILFLYLLRVHSYSVPTSNIDELHLITIVTRITLSYVLFSLLLISHNLCSTIVFYITIKVNLHFRSYY